MQAHRLAAIYASGDLPFRPRAVGRLFVIRAALRDPVKAMKIVVELGPHGCAERFVFDCESYHASPIRWRYNELWLKQDSPLYDLARREADLELATDIPF